jgi:hypothetical protein
MAQMVIADVIFDLKPNNKNNMNSLIDEERPD